MIRRIIPLYAGRFFQCYMLDESICHLSVVGSILSVSLLYYLWWKIPLANNVAPNKLDKTPHYVASDLGLHCLPMAILRASR